MASTNISVFVGKNFACMKIIGRATFASSPDFKTLVDELTMKGYSCFIIDLSECALMDSTFLGVLAGLGLKLSKGASQCQRIELLNPSPRVIELFDNLGTIHLFKVTSGEATPATDAEFLAQETINPTREQLTRTSLEAHRTLMAMNKENVARFKDVAQFLSEDLKSLELSSD